MVYSELMRAVLNPGPKKIYCTFPPFIPKRPIAPHSPPTELPNVRICHFRAQLVITRDFQDVIAMAHCSKAFRRCCLTDCLWRNIFLQHHKHITPEVCRSIKLNSGRLFVPGQEFSDFCVF